MACENDKCEKYGMHHEYKNGVEIRKCEFCRRDDQPERSKREDSVKLEYKKPIGPEGKYPAAEKLLRCGALNSMETS